MTLTRLASNIKALEKSEGGDAVGRTPAVQGKIQNWPPSIYEKISFQNLLSGAHFGGYAICFGNLDDKHDIVQPLADLPFLLGFNGPSFIRLLRDHRWEESVGTLLRVECDSVGVWVEGAIHPRYRGDLPTGLSVGFNTTKSSARVKGSPRLVHQIILAEVSLVQHPANEQAGIRRFTTDWIHNVQ